MIHDIKYTHDPMMGSLGKITIFSNKLFSQRNMLSLLKETKFFKGNKKDAFNYSKVIKRI